MAKWWFAWLPLLAACRPVSFPLVEKGGWILVEDRGSAAFVWTLTSPEEGFEPVEARSWVTFRAGVGEIGVAEVSVIDPERGRLYRFHALPTTAGVTLVTPSEIVSDREARFEFRGGRAELAGIRVWAVRVGS